MGGLIRSDVAQRIFTILLRRGRLHIYQLSAHTHLTNHQIQHGLAVLIQQNLIYHCLDKSDDRTYYEANHDAAYTLVRSGKIVELVESRFGALAKDVVQNLLLLGHTKVSDLAEAYGLADEARTNGDGTRNSSTNGANGANGNSLAHFSSLGQLHTVLVQLLRSGFLEPVTGQMFRSPTDTYNLVEKAILQDHYGGQTKGTKQKDELKIKIRHQLRTWRDEARDWKPLDGKVNGINGHSKKRRHSRGEATVNGNDAFRDEGIRLDVGS